MESTLPVPPLRELHCLQCGYNLRGIDSARCPECGTAIDRLALAQSQLPWPHREKLGRVRAYWRTVWLVTFKPRRLAGELVGPVSWTDAQTFRALTVALAFGFLGAWAVAGWWTTDWEEIFGELVSLPWMGGPTLPGWVVDLALPAAVGVSFAPVLPLGVLLWLALATGVAGWFLRPRGVDVERQNRAVALGLYTCAPLAWAWIPALGAAAAVGWARLTYPHDPPLPELLLAFVILLQVLTLVILATWWWAIVRLVQRTSGDSARATAAGVLLPLTSAVLAAFCIGGLSWVVGYLWLMVRSLG